MWLNLSDRPTIKFNNGFCEYGDEPSSAVFTELLGRYFPALNLTLASKQGLPGTGSRLSWQMLSPRSQFVTKPTVFSVFNTIWSQCPLRYRSLHALHRERASQNCQYRDAKLTAFFTTTKIRSSFSSHHDDVWGSGDIAPHISKLAIMYRRASLHPPHPMWYLSSRQRPGLDVVEKRKFCPLWESIRCHCALWPTNPMWLEYGINIP